MKKARIYTPSKNAMQSGRSKTKEWILEFETNTDKNPEPLMGWSQSKDTMTQVRLKFRTLEQAERYAEENGLYYQVTPQHERKPKPRNYGDNFKYIPPEDSESA